MTTGSNPIPLMATDASGNMTNKTIQVNVTGVAAQMPGYDFNGNMTIDGNGKTYEWDAVNRLTAINYTGTQNRTEFTYNGLSQRVKIVEKINGNVTSTKQFIWCLDGVQPCEERDGSNTVTKRFYAQGEQIGGSNYYYTRDHLGSVREMTDGTGAIRARYDYDPYGRVTKVSVDMDSDFTYAGYYNHGSSGLYLTLYRAYSADLGRWLSRDPIGEDGGMNLYGYVENDPINDLDPLGLASISDYRDAFDMMNERYEQMKKGRIRGGDKWYHCMANCEVAKKHGPEVADYLGRSKEIWDQLYNRWAVAKWKYLGGKKPNITDPVKMAEDSLLDVRHNRQGFSCPKEKTCEEQCSKYKVNGL